MKCILALLLFALTLTACKENKTFRILILGNSITHHPPLPSIGWSGDWGMAASAREKDYVHVLVGKLILDYPGIIYEEKNIAAWERDFSYDVKRANISDFNPDILIVRLGENVPENKPDYDSALNNLLDRFHANHVVITGTFWASDYKDSIQSKVARERGCEFVGLRDLWWKPAYQAIGLFESGGVAVHPGDKGMTEIANRIYEKAKPWVKID